MALNQGHDNKKMDNGENFPSSSSSLRANREIRDITRRACSLIKLLNICDNIILCAAQYILTVEPTEIGDESC
jgi:hypothetical protein